MFLKRTSHFKQKMQQLIADSSRNNKNWNPFVPVGVGRWLVKNETLGCSICMKIGTPGSEKTKGL
jgi:hypothetical protein